MLGPRGSAADITIIGAGIVGLATAIALGERHPSIRLRVLDKEGRVATGQTGHNSGVIHSGIYYKPGSFKARQCVEGARLMTEFCDAHGIAYERCGKVIVATSEDEVPRLQALHERGTANGVPGLKMIPGEAVHEYEPNCRAVRALLSPATGIVDYVHVAGAMSDVIQKRGAELVTGAGVTAIRRDGAGLVLETSQGAFATKHLVNCAGLYSDVVTRLMGSSPRCASSRSAVSTTCPPGAPLARARAQSPGAGPALPVPRRPHPHHPRRRGGRRRGWPRARARWAR
jgi:L-2-hydroxyglutarate oxidase LhgO